MRVWAFPCRLGQQVGLGLLPFSGPIPNSYPPKSLASCAENGGRFFFFFFLNEPTINISSIRSSRCLGCRAFLLNSSTCLLLLHAFSDASILTCISTFEKRFHLIFSVESSLSLLHLLRFSLQRQDLSLLAFNSKLSFRIR
jgi:hypothetical protein